MAMQQQQLEDLLSSLHKNVPELIAKMEKYKAENKQLKEDLDKLKSENSSLELELSEVKKENQALKNVNALLGSSDFKYQTKKKIDRLIKEIDQCIIELND
mgnify:CR=1 FL=1